MGDNLPNDAYLIEVENGGLLLHAKVARMAQFMTYSSKIEQEIPVDVSTATNLFVLAILRADGRLFHNGQQSFDHLEQGNDHPIDY